MPLCNGKVPHLNARNVVWLLSFCRELIEACLGCVFEVQDIKFLNDHSEAFSAASNDRKFSLGFNFTSEESSSQTAWNGMVIKSWPGGNRKTQALSNLLKVTKDLLCLELNSLHPFDAKMTSPNISCVSALQRSHLSLLHLRILNLGVNQNDPIDRKNTSFAQFENMQVLSSNCFLIAHSLLNPGMKLPSGLERLALVFHSESYGKEETEIFKLLESRSFPSLKVVEVPLDPVDSLGFRIEIPILPEMLTEGRELLMKA